MSMPAARISIIIPTYNRAAYVARAVASALQQGFAEVEVVVVDDGSTDDTRAALASYASDSRIHYHYQANRGRSTARNVGLERATGEFIVFLDSDDLLVPGGLEALHAAALADSAAGVILGRLCYVDEQETVIPFLNSAGVSVLQRSGAPNTVGSVLSRLVSQPIQHWQVSGTAAEPLPRSPLLAMLRGEHLFLGATLIRRSCLERAGNFDPTLEPCEDSDLALRLALAGEFRCIETVVAHYRRHTSNTAAEAFRPGVIRLFEKHLHTINSQGNLTPRERHISRGWCMFHLGNGHYAEGRWLVPATWYTRAAFIYPRLALTAGFWIQLGKSLLPPWLRTRLQRMVRHNPGDGKGSHGLA